MDECAQYIVDISSQLPDFTEKTFAEVLQREDEICDVARAILKEVQEIREKSQAANLEANFTRFETEYRLAVARKLDQVELFGVDVSTPSRRHRLSVAYISLSASRKAPSRAVLSTEAKMPEMSKVQQIDAEEERFSKTVDEILAGTDRAMIRGLAGSGKTTLVKWFAVQCAAQKLKNDLADLSHRIPFVIFLRQCVDSVLPAPENFVRHLVPLIADKMPSGWVHQILESGRAVVLVDGVDEVPQIERHAVYQWIKELVESYRRAKFIVTSRPTAVKEGWLAREGFVEFELEPMDLASISKFLEHWHRAVREELQSDQEKSEIDGLENSLREFLKLNRPIRNLATNPLLCATICALHRDRKKQIPAERMRLYDACCEMLLERRGTEQQLSVDMQYAPALSYSQKLVLLQDLAYYVIRNEACVISFEDADGRFVKKMANFDKSQAKFTAADVRKFLVERSGLLRVRIEARIDFVHRTFQEFLGAKAAVDENDLGLLLKNATNDQWREVIILAVGHAPRQIQKELITNLLKQRDQDKAKRHQPQESLSSNSVKLVLKARNFFDSSLNANGKGLSHFYVAYDAQKTSVVIDYATGLMWQHGGSERSRSWNEAQEYIKRLNREGSAGYDEWRLPALEEAMSLMEPKKMTGDLHIDPVFDKQQVWIWTTDKESAGQAWCVNLIHGNCNFDDVGTHYVRAVRSA